MLKNKKSEFLFPTQVAIADIENFQDFQDDLVKWIYEYKDKMKRNVEHLEIIKAYKKEDETTSIWTSESFTAIDAAIVKGKAVYS